MVLSLSLPVERIYANPRFESLFTVSASSKVIPSWYPLTALATLPDMAHAFILGSGSYSFLRELPQAPIQECPGFVYAVDVDLNRKRRERDFDRQLTTWLWTAREQRLDGIILRHADFGGVTNARFLVLERGFSLGCFAPRDGLPRTVGNILNAAAKGFFPEIPVPPKVSMVDRAPILVDGLLRKEGLYDIFSRTTHFACPSVFSTTQWVRRLLTSKEVLRMWDVPLAMDKWIMDKGKVDILGNAITPLLVSAIIRNVWSKVDRGEKEQQVSLMTTMTLTSQPERLETSGVVGTPQGDEDREIEGYTEDMERTTTASLSKSRLRTSPRPSSEVDLLDTSLRPAAEDSNAIPHTPSPCTDDPDVQLALIKLLHDEAKAVKADDAEVPVHLWNQFVARRETVDQATTKALETIRCFALRYYRRKLTRDCTKYLRTMHGQGWNAQKRRGKGNIDHDANAMKEIVWRAANNSWFEYPAGSRVHFFRFPRKYLKLARDGVPIFYKSAGPDVIKSQPPMQQEERRVLKDKIWKMWKKQYVEAPSSKLSSAIMYFAVPKGKDDWRTVFHAGANGLNDSVWAPSFWLPTVDSLLRIVDDTSFMEDRDLGEMFLNFELHHNTRRFTGIDVKPLEFSKEECPHRWLWWTKNLMGFRSSPYNSVKMYLIAEEIIKGDRLDGDNPFHWHHIELNLPGTKSYTPTRAWITKRRVDGSLATDMVVFVDDKRISGGGQQRVKEAGHASSTRESYLGIQDALRKWRSAGGTKLPGAWAGAVVHVDEEKGVMILTSQEKWDRMKEICRHWLEIVAAGETALDFKKLQSDRGFMVYATRPYPAMKPYLKGFHLSLEMWRGDRDAEGWKIKDKSTRDPDDEEDDEEAILAGLGTHVGPPSGITCAVPRFRSDLEAILVLAASPTPLKRVVRSKKMLTAYYGFGDASSDGFGATVERAKGLQGRYGLWGSNESEQSSNHRELLNLVETVEEEARAGGLMDTEMWLFTDNSVAESCLNKGSSSSPLLHELVVRLRKLEMECGLTLHVVHVAGTRMIAQGTDGLSRGLLLEGVLSGQDMLSYVDIAKTAPEQCHPVMDYVRSWAGLELVELAPAGWFEQGHGITGGRPNKDGIWIPAHAPNGRKYVWSPPPIIADVALEEALKATHKRSDAFHIFLIPRLCTTRWLRLFYKLCDFTFIVPVSSTHWPEGMHEPLFIGISLPFSRHKPWSLRGTPLLVEMERQLRQVFSEGEGDGRDILCELLRIPGRISSLPEHMARGVLRMPGDR